ncbi:MAG: diguanylate cyclase [Lachnospiraceae bacterium]|nr:diguanylate cyclase [Lachnospiraceae bacterium]
MKKSEKRRKSTGLFLSLSAVMAVPILVLGIVLVIMGTKSVSEGMELEIQKALASTAREAVAIYSLSYPGEIRMEDERFFMGDTDLTKEYTLIDQIKENTGNEISIFYGDTRMLTTITDDTGERIVHTTSKDPNIFSAIQMGNEYYSDRVYINGKYYYGYYVPLKNNGQICGMIFAGMSNESVRDSVSSIITKILIVFIIALLGVVLIASLFAGNIVKTLNQIRTYIGSLAENNFNTKMPVAVLKRTDELGDMGRHAQEVGETLQTLIYKDPLTGLYNRRAGRIELSKYIDLAEASNFRKKVVVALGDIDFFKRINDTYGHDCGDLVLTKLSDIFVKHMDKNGIPIRWGGEEFLLVFKTDYKTAYGLVESMVEEIRKTQFEYEGTMFHVTMTMGITEYKKKESIEEIVKRADDLLYKGKTGGRNQIVEDADNF